VSETPATYRRNQEYLNWRRVQQIRHQYSPDELVMFLENEVEREETYSERFNVESPADVSIAARASATDSQCRTCGKTCPPGKRHVGVSHCLSVR